MRLSLVLDSHRVRRRAGEGGRVSRSSSGERGQRRPVWRRTWCKSIPAALQRLANNARRRSRSSVIADPSSVRVHDFRQQRTDEEKAVDRNANADRHRDVRASRSEEDKAAYRASHAHDERVRLSHRNEEQKDNDQMQNTERQRNLRQQQTDDERAAVRSACSPHRFVPFSFAFVLFVLMQANAARRVVEPQRYSTRRDFHWNDPVCSSCRLIVPQVAVPSAAARQNFMARRTDYDLHGIGARFQ
jgi:hypothetical protein